MAEPNLLSIAGQGSAPPRKSPLQEGRHRTGHQVLGGAQRVVEKDGSQAWHNTRQQLRLASRRVEQADKGCVHSGSLPGMRCQVCACEPVCSLQQAG